VSPELHAHAFDGRQNLLEIADIGAQPQSGPARVLNFQMTKVQFGLAARH